MSGFESVGVGVSGKYSMGGWWGRENISIEIISRSRVGIKMSSIELTGKKQVGKM